MESICYARGIHDSIPPLRTQFRGNSGDAQAPLALFESVSRRHTEQDSEDQEGMGLLTISPSTFVLARGRVDTERIRDRENLISEGVQRQKIEYSAAFDPPTAFIRCRGTRTQDPDHAANFDLPRMRCPYRTNTNGTGAATIARHAYRKIVHFS